MLSPHIHNFTTTGISLCSSGSWVCGITTFSARRRTSFSPTSSTSPGKPIAHIHTQHIHTPYEQKRSEMLQASLSPTSRPKRRVLAHFKCSPSLPASPSPLFSLTRKYMHTYFIYIHKHHIHKFQKKIRSPSPHPFPSTPLGFQPTSNKVTWNRTVRASRGKARGSTRPRDRSFGANQGRTGNTPFISYSTRAPSTSRQTF